MVKKLFLSIPAKVDIGPVQEKLKTAIPIDDGVVFLSDEKLHITLLFFSTFKTDATFQKAVSQIVAGCTPIFEETRRFEIRFRPELAVFRNSSPVLFAQPGIGRDSLFGLHESLDEVFSKVFRLHSDFRPHMTLVKSETSENTGLLLRAASTVKIDLGFVADRVDLIASEQGTFQVNHSWTFQ